MKESTLVKMQYELKQAREALVVALVKIERLEKKVFLKDEDVK
jgi:hypothetical protein